MARGHASAASGNVRPVEVPPGCRAGRHRASGLTETLACKLRNRSHQVKVEHLHLPRVLKTSDR
ncbi:MULTISPECIES: RapZ C-terminal domain-containing protein [unclassified Kitasatospora]|uniref:RapZ C-terminal domain-containing protein n=1 Tax=Kitasatospora sp. NPDC057512 TaxID=3346154 RepID=UPI0036AA73D0